MDPGLLADERRVNTYMNTYKTSDFYAVAFSWPPVFRCSISSGRTGGRHLNLLKQMGCLSSWMSITRIA